MAINTFRYKNNFRLMISLGNPFKLWHIVPTTVFFLSSSFLVRRMDVYRLSKLIFVFPDLVHQSWCDLFQSVMIVFTSRFDWLSCKYFTSIGEGDWHFIYTLEQQSILGLFVFVELFYFNLISAIKKTLMYSYIPSHLQYTPTFIVYPLKNIMNSCKPFIFPSRTVCMLRNQNL